MLATNNMFAKTQNWYLFPAKPVLEEQFRAEPTNTTLNSGYYRLFRLEMGGK